MRQGILRDIYLSRPRRRMHLIRLSAAKIEQEWLDHLFPWHSSSLSRLSFYTEGNDGLIYVWWLFILVFSARYLITAVPSSTSSMNWFIFLQSNHVDQCLQVGLCDWNICDWNFQMSWMVIYSLKDCFDRLLLIWSHANGVCDIVEVMSCEGVFVWIIFTAFF